MPIKKFIERFKIIKDASPHDRRKIISLFKLFSRADAETAKVRSKTHLKCPPGCGRCCENPYVETTILEMLPLAIFLWQKKQAVNILKGPYASASGPCLFYKPDPLVKGHGRCSIYPFRPIICRLYGFSAAKDKYEKPHIVTCPVIKESQSKQLEGAKKMLEAGFAVPEMQDFALEIFKIDPHLGKEKLPLNIAIKIALEKIGLHFHYHNKIPKEVQVHHESSETNHPRPGDVPKSSQPI